MRCDPYGVDIHHFIQNRRYLLFYPWPHYFWNAPDIGRTHPGFRIADPAAFAVGPPVERTSKRSIIWGGRWPGLADRSPRSDGQLSRRLGRCAHIKNCSDGSPPPMTDFARVPALTKTLENPHRKLSLSSRMQEGKGDQSFLCNAGWLTRSFSRNSFSRRNVHTLGGCDNTFGV